jgi:protein O-GlcNAc transferase
MAPALSAKLAEASELLAQNRAADALVLLQPLAARHPREGALADLLGVVLYALRRFEQAAFYAQRAAGLAPGNADYATNLGLALDACGKRDAAQAAYEGAVRLVPTHARARLALANRALIGRRAAEAIVHCAAAHAAGWDAQVCMTYAGAILARGDVEGAAALTREALARFPGDATLWGGLAAALNYLDGDTVAESAAAHRRYGEILDRCRPRGVVFKHPPADDGERRLRVGIISSDLRTHSVSFFIEPFLEHHDRAAFDVFVYSTTQHPDAVTQRLRTHAHTWHDCGGMIDIEVARLVERDRCDVLVELGGHTINGQLTVMVYRPAPVQATYCGYPNTTGLSTVDWRIVDSLTDPPAGSPESLAARQRGVPDFDERCTEALWRLDPCFLCYRPPSDAPLPERLTRAGEAPTFGSFNANRKIGPGVIELWSQVLRASPGSRMLMKSAELKDAGVRERITEIFAACGVGQERLEFLEPTQGLREHLATYARVDVALDTAPYNGTTTTCEALHMGVPVVTLPGLTHASRVGVSLLTAVGAADLIASDRDAYVRLAVELANDTARLDALRASLRGALAASPLCDREGFARRFGGALREMWRRHCAAAGRG